jgi:hypothetical protein
VDGKTYRFKIYGEEFVEVKQGQDRVRKNQIPQEVRKKAEEYIPSNIEYLSEISS